MKRMVWKWVGSGGRRWWFLVRFADCSDNEM